MPYSLNNKVILISGASSGIGKSVAILSSEMGARVIILGRDEARLEQTFKCLSSTDKGHLKWIGDLAHPQGLSQLQEMLTANNIKVDGLVHSAGVSPTVALRSITFEKMQETFEANVFSAILLAKLICKPAFAAPKGQSIIFIASVMASVGAVGKSLYGMTKGALVAGMKGLALEYASKNTRFNCISPGVVLTPMSLSSVYSNDQTAMEMVQKLHPLGFGKPLDIATGAVYLLSDAAKWVTGLDFIIDGGYTAK